MVRIVMALSCLVVAACGASDYNNENDPEVVVNIQPVTVRPTLGDERCYHCQLPQYQNPAYPHGFPQPMPRTASQPSMKDMCQWNGQERAWYCQQDLTSCLIHSTHTRDTGYPHGIRTTLSQVRKCFIN